MQDPDFFVKKRGVNDLFERCPLCCGEAKFFFETKGKMYHQCGRCLGIFLDQACFISQAAEKRRYEEHNNDVNDPRYQAFVKPIVARIQERFTREHRGLDFGAGTGPVVSKLIRDKGYSIELYDPYFWNNPEVLQRKYDFIVCCEVIEHFNSPAKEFESLRLLLKPGGILFCMTNLFTENMDFKNWYYKNDQTHVFFYHATTLLWIKKEYGFSDLEISGRLAQFID